MQNGQYPDVYESFLYEFHATRDYFECHELLEEYWKAHAGDGFGDTWVGLIQLAVGLYHHRRGNKQGAAKMFRQARERLDASQLSELGIHGEELLTLIEGKIAELEQSAAFTDLNIPIADAKLLDRLRQSAELNGYSWGMTSGMDDELIHRHTRRDRSGVIAAREAAAKAKRGRLSE